MGEFKELEDQARMPTLDDQELLELQTISQQKIFQKVTKLPQLVSLLILLLAKKCATKTALALKARLRQASQEGSNLRLLAKLKPT